MMMNIGGDAQTSADDNMITAPGSLADSVGIRLEPTVEKRDVVVGDGIEALVAAWAVRRATGRDPRILVGYRHPLPDLMSPLQEPPEGLDLQLPMRSLRDVYSYLYGFFHTDMLEVDVRWDVAQGDEFEARRWARRGIIDLTALSFLGRHVLMFDRLPVQFRPSFFALPDNVTMLHELSIDEIFPRVTAIMKEA